MCSREKYKNSSKSIKYAGRFGQKYKNSSKSIKTAKGARLAPFLPCPSHDVFDLAAWTEHSSSDPDSEGILSYPTAYNYIAT